MGKPAKLKVKTPKAHQRRVGRLKSRQAKRRKR